MATNTDFSHLNKSQLNKHLKNLAEPLWDNYLVNPKPYRKLTTNLSKSPDPRVRAWVGKRDELPVAVQKALMFDDPVPEVRIAASGNTEIEHEVRVIITDRFKARVEATAPEDRPALLRELAKSYVAIERELVASYPDTPPDVRAHLAHHDRHWRVRRSAVGNRHIDPDVIDEVLEQQRNSIVLSSARRNPKIREATLRRIIETTKPGKQWWDVTANTATPSDLLDHIATVGAKHYNGDIYFQLALQSACGNPNTANDTLLTLLTVPDEQVQESAQLYIGVRKKWGQWDDED